MRYTHYMGLAQVTNRVRLKIAIYDCISKVKAKPFDTDFDLQMDSAEELYGVQLKIGFAENDIINAIDECKEYYDETIRNRVRNILLARKHKFRYLV